MSDYKIKSIGKVDFRTYKDVIRVIAIKERGFWGHLQKRVDSIAQ